MRAFPVAVVVAALALPACDRSDESRKTEAVPDDSELGVVTAPQIGHLNYQPNITGQLNVTTATTATSPTSTLGGSPNQTSGTAYQAGGTQSSTGSANAQNASKTSPTR